MVGRTSFFLVICALALTAFAQVPSPMMNVAPIKMPPKCKTRTLRTTANCACYLFVTGQIISANPETSIMRCMGMYRSEEVITRLGNSCRRFVNANMEIMADVLAEAATLQARTCIDKDAPPVMFTVAPPMDMPEPSINLLSRMCMTRRFRNIAGCACYVIITDQITSADKETSLMRCRDIIGPDMLLVKGATKCRKFIGGRSGRIMIRRLEFQTNLYVKRCLNPDAPDLVYGIPA